MDNNLRGFFMSKLSEAFKRSVVEFYQKGERGTREVGRHFGVDHATVRKWAAIYAAHGPLGQAKKSSHYDTASVLQRMWKMVLHGGFWCGPAWQWLLFALRTA
ncbi:hypothetical protein AJ87_26285 [Rhizobium yanglingense]|nr:hypothetical protein AJ87_26285 [Rhizobium yanglingense]